LIADRCRELRMDISKMLNPDGELPSSPAGEDPEASGLQSTSDLEVAHPAPTRSFSQLSSAINDFLSQHSLSGLTQIPAQPAQPPAPPPAHPPKARSKSAGLLWNTEELCILVRTLFGFGSLAASTGYRGKWKDVANRLREEGSKRSPEACRKCYIRVVEGPGAQFAGTPERAMLIVLKGTFPPQSPSQTSEDSC